MLQSARRPKPGSAGLPAPLVFNVLLGFLVFRLHRFFGRRSGLGLRLRSRMSRSGSGFRVRPHNRRRWSGSGLRVRPHRRRRSGSGLRVRPHRRRRVAPVPMIFPNHAEGAPGPTLLGTGDGGAHPARALPCGASSHCMKGARIRYQQTGEFHFLTFSCYRRRAYLSPAAVSNAVTTA
jgi:hypothetical protein